MLAFKAEVVIGVLLVVRHRTPRLAALLVLVVVTSTLAAGREVTAAHSVWLSLVVTGLLGAVAASRLLAPGANLAAGYRVASPWWLVPSGRLAGGLLALLPVVTGVALLLGAVGLTTQGSVRLSALIICYAATSSSLVLALTPVIGASAAAAIGFLLAWFGTVPPSAVALAVERWSLIRGPLVLTWNTLPFGWRAIRWFEAGNALDCGLFVCWLLAGITVSAWSLSSSYRLRDRLPGADL